MDISPSEKDIAVIILKSVYTSLAQEEQEKLTHYINASEANRAKYQELIEAESLKRKLAHYAKRNENRDFHFQTILQKTNKKAPVYPIHWFRRYSWAAAVLLLLLTGTWLLTNNAKKKNDVLSRNKTSIPQDVLPGKKGAVLTLADGSTLLLDSMNNGIVALQQDARVELQNGQLAYDAVGIGNGDLIYNTLATPKGREFKVLLPDGTQAWLNSASSIRYPIQFASNERVVYITGEVYFEVTSVLLKDKKTKTPFIVKISSPGGDAGIVEVLGTHFNINAYENKSKTTLLEGAVRVKAQPGKDINTNAVILQPGQQAQVSVSNHDIKTINADVDKVMAWRRGFFNFENANLEEVMQQLARWYDIEVEYETGVPAITFEGELSRNMKLSGVLKALEDSKVHLKLEGRKIIVLQ